MSPSSVPAQRLRASSCVRGLVLAGAVFMAGPALASYPGCDAATSTLSVDAVEFVQRVRTSDWLAMALVRVAGEPDACRVRAGSNALEPLQLDLRWRSGIRFTLTCAEGECRSRAHAQDGLPGAGLLRRELRFATVRATGQDALQLQAWREGDRQFMEFRAEEQPVTGGRLEYESGLLTSVTTQRGR